MNVDASVLKDGGVVGYGFVVRYSHGRLLVVGSKGEHRSCSILEADAKSLLWGIKKLVRGIVFPLMVESDNKMLVDLVHGKAESSLVVGLIILNVFDFVKKH